MLIVCAGVVKCGGTDVVADVLQLNKSEMSVLKKLPVIAFPFASLL
jgi:hypothetical protein